MLAYITNIYNSAFRLGYYPLLWKHAKVLPIPKINKKPNLLESYRPISLLPTLAKILDKIILTRLTNFLDQSKVIPQHQFGFRKYTSTHHPLLKITEYIHQAFQKKFHTIAVFLDISQAFDRIWHEALIYKIKKLGTPQYLTDIISSFLQNRTFSVSTQNHPFVPSNHFSRSSPRFSTFTNTF